MLKIQTAANPKSSKRLLSTDIRSATSEMLLFTTLFGTDELKRLAKTELSRRIYRDEDEIGDYAANHNFSIAANC